MCIRDSHQGDCLKSRNALRDGFNAMFTCNGIDRELVKVAISGREY